MYGYMNGFGGGWIMGLIWIVLIAIAVVVVFRLARPGGGRDVRPPGESPETILKQRYARGEISREEYERLLEDLRR